MKTETDEKMITLTLTEEEAHTLGYAINHAQRELKANRENDTLRTRLLVLWGKLDDAAPTR